MITAVDTNVLIDVLGANATFGPVCSRAIRRCLGDGALVACEIVWAETTANFVSGEAARTALGRLRVEFSAVELASAAAAGESWRRYRQAGGSRQRAAPDFFIGAHALRQADRLLTRDRGFYRGYFDNLEILDPTA
ncbi:MAG TPA: type II toxin-antitoxin system VapC family toxin [Solirubrobacteraceae bacterium]|nr:type II toxin-antitoxin system VapC family toxin [Solirubrobacteraceae bacterium]